MIIKNQIQKINFTRQVILSKILEKRTIDIVWIKKIETQLEKATLGYFKDFTDYDIYNLQISDKDSFKAWSIFSILFPFYYDNISKKVNDYLNRLSQHFQTMLVNNKKKTSLKSKEVSFLGMRNFGERKVVCTFSRS